MNISSIVVQAKSEDIAYLVDFFKKCDFCDYHFSDEKKGKIILTIEAEDVSGEIAKLKQIEQTQKVISAEMMMSYSEDELDKQRKELELRNEIPAILNDDNIKAEDIDYKGDLKNKF